MMVGQDAANGAEQAIATLVERAQTGDAEAFGALYDEFARRVYAYCLLRVRSAADAEDLTQLTFLKVVEALPRYESRGVPFAAWLFTLARNAVIDHVRRRHDHATLDELADTADPAEIQAPVTGRLDDDLAAALPALTPEQRDVLAYRFFAGLSTRETARLMHRDEAAVRALQHRAIGALRRRLTPSSGRVPRPGTLPEPGIAKP